MLFLCARCGKKADKPAGAVNRARKQGAPLYCTRECAGLARRKNRSLAELKEQKRLYDVAYRAANLTRIKANKRANFQRTYDPVKAAKERKKRMPKHVEYCRRPEYRRWKSAYDRRYKALKNYGEFSDAYLSLLELDEDIRKRITDYEKRIENGTICKTQKRRRQDRTHSSGRAD
jgi:membrane-bound lytic murein transglycosylase